MIPLKFARARATTRFLLHNFTRAGPLKTEKIALKRRDSTTLYIDIRSTFRLYKLFKIAVYMFLLLPFAVYVTLIALKICLSLDVEKRKQL